MNLTEQLIKPVSTLVFQDDFSDEPSEEKPDCYYDENEDNFDTFVRSDVYKVIMQLYQSIYMLNRQFRNVFGGMCRLIKILFLGRGTLAFFFLSAP